MPQENDQWFYGRNNAQNGPVSKAQLAELARMGGLSPGDLVWTAGMPQWAPAGAMGDLFPGISTGGTMPLPPPLSQTQGTLQYQTPQQFFPPPGYNAANDLGQNAGMRMLLPVGRSGWAIAAGYAGLFAVIPFFAPIALIFGVLALKEIRRNPQLHGKGRAIFGIVMGVIFSVLLAFMIVALAEGHVGR